MTGNPLQAFDEITAAHVAEEEARADADRDERRAEREQRFEILRDVLIWLGIPESSLIEDRNGRRGDYIYVQEFYFCMSLSAERPVFPDSCILWERIKFSVGLRDVVEHPNRYRLGYHDRDFDIHYTRVIEQDRPRIMAAMAYGMAGQRKKRDRLMARLNAPEPEEDWPGEGPEPEEDGPGEGPETDR